jgi:hypothetical protein
MLTTTPTTSAEVQPDSGVGADHAQTPGSTQASAQAPCRPEEPPDVFVCYSHADREQVESIVDRLKGAGIKVCVDYRDMLGGESPRAWMELQTRRCRHVMPLLSPDWLRSSWADLEFCMADQDRADWERRVVPVMIETCVPPRSMTAVHNYINLADLSHAHMEWERLIRSLREGPPPAPHPPDVRSIGLRDLAALLKTPEIREKVVMFKEVFLSACAQISLVRECKRLHDKLQEVQAAYRTVARLRQVAGSGGPDWERLDVDGDYLLGLLGELVKEAREGEFTAKQSLWIVKFESSEKVFSQAVTARDARRLESACTVIEGSISKKLLDFNIALISAVRMLNLPSLVGCLSEIRRKLEGMLLDEVAKKRFESFTRGLEALEEMSARWEAMVAQHDELQSIDDALATAPGATREDFDCFLMIWSPIYEEIRRSARGAWPDRLRSTADAVDAAADAVDAAASERNSNKTERLFEKLRDLFSRFFKNFNSDMLRECLKLEDLGRELKTLLEMTSDA